MKKYKIIKGDRIIFDGPRTNGIWTRIIDDYNRYGFVKGNDYTIESYQVQVEYEVYSPSGRMVFSDTSIAELSEYLQISKTYLLPILQLMENNPDMEDELGRHYVAVEIPIS